MPIEPENCDDDPIVVTGTVNIGTMPEVEIKNDVGSPIPVSGTVTSTQGTSPWVVSGTVITTSRVSVTSSFSGIGTGATQDVTSTALLSFAIQVKGVAVSATSWTVILEGSLDGTNFSTMLNHTTSTGDGAVLWAGATVSPVNFFRIRVSALVLGPATSITVLVLGVS